VLREAVEASVYRGFELVHQLRDASVHSLNAITKCVVPNNDIATSEFSNDYIEPLRQVVQDAEGTAGGDDNILKCGVRLVIPVVRGVERLGDEGCRGARGVAGGWARAARSGRSLDISPGIMAAEDVGGLCFRLGSREGKKGGGGAGVTGDGAGRTISSRGA
jgi:hypothetical protein